MGAIVEESVGIPLVIEISGKGEMNTREQR